MFVVTILFTASLYSPKIFGMEMDFLEHMRKIKAAQEKKDYTKEYLQEKYKDLKSKLPDRKRWRNIWIENRSNKKITVFYKGPCPGFEGPGFIKERKIILEPGQHTGDLLVYNKYQIKILEKNNSQETKFFVKKNGVYKIKKKSKQSTLYIKTPQTR